MTDQNRIDERVIISIKSHIADVRLARPDKMNAVDERMFRALADAAELIGKRADVRAVVLSGQGRCFCAGLDLSQVGYLSSGEGRHLLLNPTHGDANMFQQSALAWRNLPVPVIASIHGVCYGAGLQIALGADIRFCAPDAKLSVMEMKWGLVPDMAGTLLMKGLVRDDVARDLIYTARVFEGEEARMLGIATYLSADPLNEAIRYAQQIAAKSPAAMRAAKTLINAAATATPAETLANEAQAQAALLGGADIVESLRAHQERRPPVFDDPPLPS